MFLRFLLQVGLQSILVLGIIVFGFLLVDDTYVRWDLTEDQRFTISDASHDLAAGLEDPLTIHIYVSSNLPPRYEPMQRQVLDVLAEYEAASGGKIKVEKHDPVESRTAENEAKNRKVQPVNLPVAEATSVSWIKTYGGIVLVYRDQSSEVINFAERYLQGYEGLSSLEYELSSKIWQLSNEKPKIGLTGYLSSRPPMPMGPRGGQPQPKFNMLRRLLGEDFQIESVDLKTEQPDPAKIPLLLVVRPREFSDVEVFRLDQYLLKGGRVILFVSKGEITATQWSPNLTWQRFKTGLDAWLEFQGVRIPDEFVVHGHTANKIRVQVDLGGGLRGYTEAPSWFRPIIAADVEGAMDKKSPVVNTLKRVELYWPHPVDLLADRIPSTVKSTVLVQSHKQESWRWKNLQKVDMRLVDPQTEGPKSETDLRASPVCVSLEGTFNSYFADKGAPPSLTPRDEANNNDEKKDGEKDGENKDDEKKDKPKGPEVVKQSAKTGYLVVVGNTIFISDDVLQQTREGGVSDAAREATLLAFNLTDWLARSEALIALRAKSFSNRRIKDEAFDDDVKALVEQAQKGDITKDKFREKYDQARDAQKARRKRARWKNILLPCMLIVGVGAIVWILRAAFRAKAPVIPPAEPPASVSGKE